MNPRHRLRPIASPLILALALVAAALAGVSRAQEQRAEDDPGAQAALARRILRVERGLVPQARPGRSAKPVQLAERMKRLNVPGVSVAVINHSAIEWARGYGVLRTGGHERVGLDTLFQAASISKPVAAAGTLRLVEQGKLDLDEDVNQALQSWKLPENDFTRDQKVTLRRLLSHAGGLTVSGFQGYAADEPLPTLVQILDGVPPANSAPVRVDIPPGTRWRYSGGGYVVLQQLLADVTGEPFPQFMREAVLDRVGMRHSTFDQPLPAHFTRNAAIGHRADGAPLEGRWHTYPELAAAGLWTTPSDLARFAIEIQAAATGRSHRLLSTKMAGEMVSRQIDHWGLGLRVDGFGEMRRFSHSGGNEGFRCFMVAYERTGQGAVVMTNSDNGGELAQELVVSVAREYRWPGYLPRARAGQSRRPVAAHGED